MATRTKVFCVPCDFKHITVPAVAWCPICNEGTCSDCKDQHSAFSLTRNHEIINIGNYKTLPDFVVRMEITCNEHDKKLDFYCRTHNERCCLNCVPEKHKGCPNVTDMGSVVKDVKMSPSFIDAIQGWEDLLQNVTEVIRVKQENMEQMNETKITIETEMKSFRKEINDLLDKFEMRTLHNLDNIHSRATTETKNVISDLNDKRGDIGLFLEHCESVKAFASDQQAFVAIGHMSDKLTEEERKFVCLVKGSAFQSTDFIFEKNDVLRSFGTRLKDFGKIKVSSRDSNFKLSQRKSDQAQFMPIAKVQHSNSQTLTFCLKESLYLPSDKYAMNIKDCTVLPDDRYLFTDFSASKRLLTLNQMSKDFMEIILPLPVCGVTCVEGSFVALLFQDENEVWIIELQNTSFKLGEKIKLQTRGWSLSSYNAKIAISLKDVGILLMDKMGKQFAKIQIRCESYVAVHLARDYLYYVDLPSHTIHCCSYNGKHIWKYQISNQRNQYSLTTDNHDHVYLSCLHTNEIILISRDGKTSRSIVTIDSPIALAFNRATNELLSASSDGKVEIIGVS